MSHKNPNTVSLEDGRLPILPLRDIVVFPKMIVPLFVGREKSVSALQAASQSGKQLLMLTQKDPQQEDPSLDDLYEVGVVGRLIQLLKLPDGTVKALVEGERRILIRDARIDENYFTAGFDLLPDQNVRNDEKSRNEMEALTRTLINRFEDYIKTYKRIPVEAALSFAEVDDGGKLADQVTALLNSKIEDKQKVLECRQPLKRLEMVYRLLEAEMEMQEVEKKIRTRVKKQMDKSQRDYYLNEQMKAIRKELGDNIEEQEESELAELKKGIEKSTMPKDVKDKALQELKKLKAMPPMSGETTIVRNYLDTLLELPWGKKSKLNKDIKLAQETLDKGHFGLEKVKDRIVEQLAVQQRVEIMKGPILCLVGPPGVGKTSLAKSIAEATGRQFIKMSLGGVRDEAEIRGHRRTYLGALPGKIIQGMKKAKANNPLFLLDEIDKISHSDFRGDPASALLEVLDPEQNHTFNDHYLELDYDLSKVMFVCTANTLRMPQPLLDRLEVIRLSGYTEDEKVGIANEYLIKKQMEMAGLKAGEVEITEAAIRDLIRYYTREAGVRNLEREIASLCRKALKDILLQSVMPVEEKNKKRTKKSVNSLIITPDNLGKYAGVRRHRYGEIDEEDGIGMVNGLAWTEVGGDILTIESVTYPGKGKVTMTGKLGEVMKESIQAAEMLVKSRSASLGIHPRLFKEKDIHLHVPEGATPKDGPSAGIAMVTSMVSVLTGIPVRRDIGMTGEITLRGRVLPIGGLKEKLIAAMRAGIKKVLIPQENLKDLEEIPNNVKGALEIIPVRVIDEVLGHALVRQPLPVVYDDVDLHAENIANKNDTFAGSSVVRH